MDSVRIIVDRVIKYYSKMFLLRGRKGKEKRKIHSSIKTIKKFKKETKSLSITYKKAMCEPLLQRL